jgi:hypothetical protein
MVWAGTLAFSSGMRVAQKLKPVAQEGDEDDEAERMVSVVQIVTPQ